MPAAVPLTSSMASSLPRGVPSSVLSVGPVLTVLANIVLTWDDPEGYETFAQLTGARVWLDYGAFGALLLGCASGWWAPRLAAVSAALISLPDAPALTAAWAVVLLADVRARARQRDTTSAWYGTAVLPPAPGVAPAAHRGLRVAAETLLLVAAAAATLTGWQARAAVVEMHDRGVETPASVVSVDTFDDSLVVDVEGHEHDFWVVDASSYRPGQSVVVLTDPLGFHRPVGFGDFDPDGSVTFALMLLGALTALVVGVHVILPARWRRVRDLAARPSPALVVSLALHGRFVEVYPLDATPGTPALLRLSAPVPGHGDGTVVDRLLETWERLDDREPVERDLDRRETFVLRGFRGHGDLCLVHDDEQVVALLRPARDARTLAYLAHRGWTRVRA